MEKKSDYKHDLELALCDLDDFFLSCQVYGIKPEDVISSVVDGLSSYLHESFKSEKGHVNLTPGEVVTFRTEDNSYKVRFSSAGFSSWDVSCGFNNILLTFNSIKVPTSLDPVKVPISLVFQKEV